MLATLLPNVILSTLTVCSNPSYVNSRLCCNDIRDAPDPDYTQIIDAPVFGKIKKSVESTIQENHRAIKRKKRNKIKTECNENLKLG